MEFKTHVELGDHYRDEDTGFEGVADSITFGRGGCPRVKLRALVSSVPAEHWIDEPRLTFFDPADRALGFG